MELAKIEALIDLYFEGETTLEQERVLQNYFSGSAVAPQLEMYRAMFNGFEGARKEHLQKELILPQKKLQIKPMWYSIAAVLVVALTVAGFLFNQPSISTEEKEAIAAFKETKKALDLFSKNFNEGAEELAYIHQFTKSKNRILK